MNDPDLLAGLTVFFLLSVFGSLVLLATHNHRQTLRFQIELFVGAFFVRFAMSIMIYHSDLVNVLGDEDSSGWVIGEALQQAWVRQGIDLLGLPAVLGNAFDGPHRGYYYLLGVFFYLTNTSTRLAAAALNGFFGALTAVFAYRVAHTLFSPWVAVRVGWCTCFFPSMIIWSAQTVKEPVVILLEMFALYGCVQLKRNGFSLRHLLLCTLAIVFLLPFRFYMVYVSSAAVILTLAMPRIRGRRTTLTSALSIGVFLMAVFSLSGLSEQQEVEVERLNLEYLQNVREKGSMGTGSGVESHYDMQTPAGFGLATAVGAAHLLLAPFPWQLASGSLRMLLTVPELLVWWWVFFVGVLPGLRYGVRTHFIDILPLLTFLIGLGLLYSLTFSNVGLVYRQRAQLLPWLLMIGMLGLEQRTLRRLAARRSRIGGHVMAATR